MFIKHGDNTSCKILSVIQPKDESELDEDEKKNDKSKDKKDNSKKDGVK